VQRVVQSRNFNAYSKANQFSETKISESPNTAVTRSRRPRELRISNIERQEEVGTIKLLEGNINNIAELKLNNSLDIQRSNNVIIEELDNLRIKLRSIFRSISNAKSK